LSAQAPALIRTWKVSRYTVTLTASTVQPGSLAAIAMEWSPELPERLTEAEIAEYVRGRNAALAELAAIASPKP